jgi:hypothetical protein
MIPLEFHPTNVFDETKHVVDVVAKEYLGKATGDVHHLVPAKVIADGNCLYHSIVLLMNNPAVTTSELRGRQIYFSFMLLYNLFFKIIFSSNYYRTCNK